MGQKDKGETTKITPKLLILKDKETFLFFGFFLFFFFLEHVSESLLSTCLGAAAGPLITAR